MRYLLKRGEVYLVNFTYGRTWTEEERHALPGYEGTTNIVRATRFPRFAAHLISTMLPAVEGPGAWEVVAAPE